MAQVSLEHAGAAPAEGQGAGVAPRPAPRAEAGSVITDSKGRRLTLRELTLLEETDLLAAMGAEHSANQMLIGRALLAGRIADIDGQPVKPPRTHAEYRAMLQRVGREGMEAVLSATAPEDDAAGIDAAKN